MSHIEALPALPDRRPAKAEKKTSPSFASAEPRPTGTDRLLWILALVLLAAVQLLWAGYRLGVGNQSIQIPFLKHWINPNLYGRDPMVRQTLAAYPSYFFRALATVVAAFGLADVYFWLHLLTAFGVLWAAAELAKVIFKQRSVGIVVALLLLAGHHRALAGDDLYSAGFTHTWAVMPLAILAMLLLYRGWALAAFALAGVIFDLHALTGAYLAFMFGVWAVCDRKAVRWYKLPAYALIFLWIASPTLSAMGAQQQSFDAQWIKLTHIRSADHSFPSSWWQDGIPDVPRFGLLVALGALSLGFAMPREQRRKSLMMAAAVGGLFLVGYVFSEFRPRPDVLRAQLFRSGRLLLVIVFCHISYGIVRGFRMAKDGELALPAWRRNLEAANALFTLLCVAIPAMLPLLPYALLLGTLVALINGRLHWTQALAAGSALLIALLAAQRIHFEIPGVRFGGIGGTGGSWWKWVGPVGGSLAWVALLLGIGVWAVGVRLRSRELREVITLFAMAVAPAVLIFAHTRLANADAADPWADVQSWARSHTPANAVFLTPAQRGGFRIGSERAVVGEWRDGTQLYFSADYGPEWWQRMQDLQPGLLQDTSGRELLSRGSPLEDLDDARLVSLCKQYNADYVVLPNPPTVTPPRQLALEYANPQWAVYTPRIVQPPQPDFMRDVVWPNIEKYRKSDARIQVVDADGRPVQDLPFEITQVTSDFKWSTALNFFKVPAAPSTGDFKPGAVQPEELKHFGDIFNFSLIPFSGKWMYVEPTEGHRDYADLDAYVDWCTSHQVGMEFHFLSGYAPRWALMKTLPEQQKLFMDHARDLVQRYKGRIEYWQVVNERHGIQLCPPVFAEIRKIDPNAKFGISDCSQFWIPRPERYTNSASPYLGIAEVRWLKSQGVKMDFFAFHGHRPFGVWPDAQQMYTALDTFANEGLRIHISEFTLPLGGPIYGPGRKPPYEKWTPEKQAEFYAWYYTVCFSHPAVDMIDLWGFGPDTWQKGSGLLDKDFQPKPNFDALRDLIKVKFMTRLSGKLPLDGAEAFRGFHGGYEIAVTLPDGGKALGTFAVKAGENNTVRLVLDRDGKTLAR